MPSALEYVLRRGRRRRNAIQPFLPTDIDGAVLWLRADLGVTEAGTGVSAWANQGSLGGSFTQGTDSARPSLGTSAALNDRPVIDPNGSSDFLVSTLPASAWNFLHDGSGSTLIIVCDLTSATQCLFNTTETLTTSGRGCFVRKLSGGQIQTGVNNASGTAWVFVPSLAHTDGPTAYVLRHATDDAVVNDYDIRWDATSKGAAAYTSAPDTGDANVTARLFGSAATGWTTDPVAEVIAYNKPLSTDELATVEAYLTQLYGEP